MGTATGQVTATVRDAHVGQVVTVEGEFYRVAEVNLAHPHRPALVPVFNPPAK